MPLNKSYSMQRKKTLFKHRLEYSLFTAVVFLIKYSPPWCVTAWSRTLVFLLKKGSRKHARLIAENLAVTFPAATAESLADLQNKIYNHFGRMFVEIARTFARQDPQAVLSRSRILHPEVVERALQKKRGLILFSAHFGNWEWIPLILHTHLGRDIHSIARPMDNPLLEKKIRGFREAMGSKIIYKKGSLRSILTRLGDNQIVFLLIDQNTVPREGVFVDFFSRKASSNTAVAQLYLKKNIPVVPVFLHYEGKEIILDVLPEIDFCAAGGGADGLLELTQQMTGLIEAQIRKFPEQWLWFHDRWKTRPQGATK
jgi:KDO2-lipid IV(A) lauroyltransferase